MTTLYRYLKDGDELVEIKCDMCGAKGSDTALYRVDMWSEDICLECLLSHDIEEFE